MYDWFLLSLAIFSSDFGWLMVREACEYRYEYHELVSRKDKVNDTHPDACRKVPKPIQDATVITT